MHIKGVLNHHSVVTYAGLATHFELIDLRRLCWLWEWDGVIPLKNRGSTAVNEESDNPFLQVLRKVPLPNSFVRIRRHSRDLVLSQGTSSL